MKNKIYCMTPVDNIPGIKEKILSLGEVIFDPDPKLEFLRDNLIQNESEVIFTNPNRQNFMLNKEILEGTKIKIICTASTATNHIDKKYCEEKNIKIISITKDYNLLNQISSTAELAFTLMMSSLRNIVPGYDSVKNGNWNCELFIGRQIDHLKIGIVGYGRLGKMMSKFCDAFGAEVRIYDPYVYSKMPWQVHSLEELFKECDVVSLHVHATDETKYMIGKELFSLVKPEFILVNTSRGEIVNEEEIVEFLNNGTMKYATDVIIDEFSPDWYSKSPLINRVDKGLLITPHIGGMTLDARKMAYGRSIYLLKEHLSNEN